MKVPVSLTAVAIAMVLAMPVRAGGAGDLAQLKRQVEQLKNEYEARLRDLEQRLAAAEAAAKQPAPAPAPQTATTTRSGRGSTFNPAVGLVLNGRYVHRSGTDPEGVAAGVSAGPETEAAARGFSLGESELNLNANIDDRLFGNLTVAFAAEDGEDRVELEEAYIQTLGLPAGLTLRGGRFFSGIGYLNEFHRHSDDFADRPLPYRAFLANQYRDDGIQLRWLAPTDRFVEVGAELLRGDAWPAAGAANNGVGAHSVFVHTGGDVGTDHSWRAGLSWLSTRARERESGTEDGPDLFTGDGELWVADFVWKWAPGGNPGQRNAKLQGELFRREERGLFNDLDYDGVQTGWYLQGVYQFMPRWRVGLRHAEISPGTSSPALEGTTLDAMGHLPRHTSVMLDWSRSEFSRLRLQYSHDRSQSETANEWTLQYLMNLGAHGGHKF